MKYPTLLCFFLFLFSFSVVGDITIKVQSENPKNIEIVSLNQTIMGNISNGENISLNYDNYIVRIVADTESGLGFGNLWGFLEGINSKWVYFVIIIIMCWMIIEFVRQA